MKEAFELIRKRLEPEADFFSGEPMGSLQKAYYCKGVEKAMEIVSEVEAEYGNGWIDVKDRLPEKNGYYLTCDHKGNMHVFYHHPICIKYNTAFGIGENHPQFYKPIAWMPLPEAYKPTTD